MRIFLELKHWQLFLMVVGIPILSGILDALILVSGAGDTFSFRIFLNFLNILAMWFFYLWIWSVGSILGNRVENKEDLPKNVTLFPWILLVSLLTSTALVIWYWWDLYGPAINGNQDTMLDQSYITLVLLAFIAIVCLFVSLNFMVKILVIAERNSLVKPNDFFSEYVMAVVFPIGIWILQPRIDKLSRRS